MTDRPILFSSPMVRAILDGRKTQTRRVVKLPHQNRLGIWEATTVGGPGEFTYGKNGEKVAPKEETAIWHTRTGTTICCPYGQPGDRLWVRETWQTYKEFDRVRPNDISNQSEIQYPATYDGWDSRKRPSIHMPRWASRITLEITNVLVERLHDISNDDAKAEGYPSERNKSNGSSEIDAWLWFRDLWQSINGPESWSQNPFVWVIEFKRVKT